MFDFDPKDYRNFVYGVVSKKHLKENGYHAFSLWDEEWVLFWNKGDVRSYKNACPHYGLPLSRGKVKAGRVHCGFHGWQFDLTEGQLIKAPYAKKQPYCKLSSCKAFVKGGIVFVYPGEEDHFEKAKQYIFDEVIQAPASAWVVYEVPFYLAINSSTDYPHHAYHSFFYILYSAYRALFCKKNPLLTTYSPTMIEENDRFFKFKIPENGVEITVHPFCTEYNDLVSSNKWQIFVSPISKNKSRYFINIQSFTRNPVYRALTYLFFHTVIKYSAMPEDQAWLKASYQNRQNKKMMLCDHDFGLKNYLRKFFIKPKV